MGGADDSGSAVPGQGTSRSSGTGSIDHSSSDFVLVTMRVTDIERNSYPPPIPRDADPSDRENFPVPRFSVDTSNVNAVTADDIVVGDAGGDFNAQAGSGKHQRDETAFTSSARENRSNRRTSSFSTASSADGQMSGSEDYSSVGRFGLGNRHVSTGGSSVASGVNLLKKPRRKTKVRYSSGGGHHRGLRGPRKTTLTTPTREMPTTGIAFFTEIFKLKGTILFKTVPQIVLAALVGLFANLTKIIYCGEGVATNEECDVTFNLDGHLGVSVVLSFLLVFRADLAWKRYEQGKAALGAVHGGVRNLNVAAAVFLRPKRHAGEGGEGVHTGGTAVHSKDNTGNKDPRTASTHGRSRLRPKPTPDADTDDATSLDADRGEIFRLTNLLYAFVRHAARGQRHGYSDVGPVTDAELLTRDRGGKPRVPDLFLDSDERVEFKNLDSWNRPNTCASKIARIVEHRRRVGSLGERAAMDAFRDLKVVLDALKSMERIVTTPIPYQYLHMLNVLLFFFVYSVPFVFTSNFKWVTPFPSAVVALAFYGVNAIGACMEDPFSWEEPCHDLSAVGWRVYRENAQIHVDADSIAKIEESRRRVASVETLNTRTRLKAPTAVSDDNTRYERHGGHRSTRMTQYQSYSDYSETYVDEPEDDRNADDSATTLDPSMIQKELSTHWSGFFTEIFVFRDTVMPTLLPQILVAFCLGVAAQVIKMRACGADVVAAAECQTTFDITGHQVVSVSLGFLLVFRTDWAYDRYYEGKSSLGQLYSGVRNLNVLFINFLRENRVGECTQFERNNAASNVDGRNDINFENRNVGKITARTSHGSAAGTYDEFDWSQTQEQRKQSALSICEDRAELLRLTNVMYALMRHALRELRVGRTDGNTSMFRKQEPAEPSTSAEVLFADPSGSPHLPDFLRKGEAERLLNLSPSNRHNWIAMQIQKVVETNRRLGFIGERASFEIYQELELCLAAYKSMERIVSTPIPHTYTHMLQLILFFFVFSAPFVFTTTFHWIAFVPSVIVAIGFYGVNEMGKVIQDPFDWRQPCHDLSGIGRRAFEENLTLHEHAEKKDDDLRKEELRKQRRVARRSKEEAKRGSRNSSSAARDSATSARDSETTSHENNTNDSDSEKVTLKTLRAALEGRVEVPPKPTGPSTDTSKVWKSKTLSIGKQYQSQHDVPDLHAGPWSFITTLFKVKHTVLPRVLPQVLFAVISSLIAQTLKIYWCGADIVSHSQCSIAFSETAHAVAGGVIGFMLVFRTSISYYRFYESKKYLGHLHDSLRNANVAFCAFLRTSSRVTSSGATDTGDKNTPADSKNPSTPFDAALNSDRIELRRFSNVLFAFVRQSVRERRHGYPAECVLNTKHNNTGFSLDDSLLNDDVYGAPSLGTLLTDSEKLEFKQVDPNNRANMVVWRMQSIVERHRRAGNVCERGAFDIYHDLEACLEAHKHMERIVNTKMPFQYLHAVNFLLFVFVFSAPFVFTTGFKWLSPVPSCIVAVAFYGVAEVARSIEDPYSWEQPSHDLSGVGWRLFVESLELHEQSVVDEAGLGFGHAKVTNDSCVNSEVSPADVSLVTIDVEHVTLGTDTKLSHSVTPSSHSLAHGAADSIIVVSGRPQPDLEVEKAFTRLAKATKDESDLNTESCNQDASMDEQEDYPFQELSNSRFGFFTDVFRVRGTVHGEVLPQVVLAFVVGWAAQLLKLWRCGGMVQEAYECSLTFEPHAHAVVGSVLAFMIVYRFKFAYDRYYEAKTAISELHCGLRNFNIGCCAFLRLDGDVGGVGVGHGTVGQTCNNLNKDSDSSDMFFWKKNPGAAAAAAAGKKKDSTTSGSSTDTSSTSKSAQTTSASSLLRQRTEMLRLSGLLFGFLRHRLREHRLGYPDNKNPGDFEVLTSDVCGAPKLGTLLKDTDELKKYASTPFRNRPNVAATEIQLLVERLRRKGKTCERGAFDLYRECERVLAALTCCERIVETPVPFQYVQMSHFVTFFFVYSAPFIFTTSYQYISFFPSCLLAMAFYGINAIGEVIERPFDWKEPNHNLARIGLRVWRECAQLHARCAAHDQATIAVGDDAHNLAVDELDRLIVRAASDDTDVPTVGRVRVKAGSEVLPSSQAPSEIPHVPSTEQTSKPNAKHPSSFELARSRRQSAFQHARLLKAKEYPRLTFSFLTGLFSGSSSALRRALPQVVCAAATGVFANAVKHLWCGSGVTKSSECALTFHTEAHAICGAIIGFLLVFCANIGYVKFYEAKTASGAVYHGLRNINILSCSFLRASFVEEPGYVVDDESRKERLKGIEADVAEIARLVDILFAFLRVALREQRHGYQVVKNMKSTGDEKNKNSLHGWRKKNTGKVSDFNILTDDLSGSPSLRILLTDEERHRYLSIDPGNRFNIVVGDLHRQIEKRRATGDVYEKAAHEMYRECDLILAAYKTCERIVTTPIPCQYTHMVNLVLFCFVFSAPFVFSATFDWLTPAPSAILALGFYGIWEVGKTMMDPFDWNSPCVDLTAIGRRVSDEGKRIGKAARDDRDDEK